MFVITSEACRMIELTYFLKGHVFNFFIKKLFLKTVQHVAWDTSSGGKVASFLVRSSFTAFSWAF